MELVSCTCIQTVGGIINDEEIYSNIELDNGFVVRYIVCWSRIFSFFLLEEKKNCHWPHSYKMGVRFGLRLIHTSPISHLFTRGIWASFLKSLSLTFVATLDAKGGFMIIYKEFY